ncbi:hypothetical protein ABPG72_020067 [Tetrahymena utriculariae]
MIQGFIQLVRQSPYKELVKYIYIEKWDYPDTPFRVEYRLGKKEQPHYQKKKSTRQDLLPIIQRLQNQEAQIKIAEFLKLIEILKPHAFVNIDSEKRQEIIRNLTELANQQKFVGTKIQLILNDNY